MPPTRMVRYCCSELKEGGGQGRIKILGVREEESSKRKGRKIIMLDGESSLGKIINIIYQWTETDVWEFIGCNLIDYCSLYDEGFARLGCVGCPLGSIESRERGFKRWPAYRRAYVKAFDRMITERKRRGKVCDWADGEAVMQWWMYGKPKEDENQLKMRWEDDL